MHFSCEIHLEIILKQLRFRVCVLFLMQNYTFMVIEINLSYGKIVQFLRILKLDYCAINALNVNEEIYDCSQ